MTSDVLADPSTRPASRPRVAGNRLALAGTVVYLLEWVAIIGASVQVPIDPATTTSLADGYVGKAGDLTFAAGWFALVLVGRLVFVAGVAQALRGARTAVTAPRWLVTCSISAMAVSVAIEVTTYAMTAGIAANATSGAVRDLAVPNAMAWTLNLLVPAAFGISTVTLAAAMWHSRCFSRVLVVLGLAGGLLMGATALLVTPSLAGAYAAVLGLGTLLSWIWMLWTGIAVWRAPRPV
ncbi:MAG: hypothetical protein JOZ82_05985 [Marmoricola sp.]|nr:hypothetical protein [Marmoricola sp.]